MAEALGFGAAILAFVELGAEVAKVLTKYCVEVYRAPKELRKLSAELHSINMIGNLMKAHRNKIEETLCNTDIEALLSTRLKAWKDSMRKLTEFLNKMLSSGLRGSTFTNWKALILPFTSTIEKRTGELKELKIDFIFILQLSNEDVTRNIFAIASKTRDVVQNWRNEYAAASLEIRREEIYRWLKPENFDDDGDKFDKSYIQGSCDWITIEEKFKDWRGAGNNIAQRFLWVYGDMGYGKTFLSQFIRRILQASLESVIYFSFDSTRDLYTAQAFFQALLYVLLRDVAPEELQNALVEKLHQHRSKRGPSQSMSDKELQIELSDALKSMSTIQVSFIVDGLDECRNDERKLVVKRLTSLVRNFKQVSVLILGREGPSLYSDIIKEADVPDWDQSLLSLKVTGNIAQDGVNMFVRERVRQCEMLANIADVDIIGPVTKRASGWYLFARLLIEDLKEEIYDEDLKRKLKELPEGLEEVFKNHLDRIERLRDPKPDLAKRIFAWLTVSVQPLTLTAFWEALQESKTLLIPARTLVDICSPFCEVGQDRDVLQFIHASVKEHFSSKAEQLSKDKNGQAPNGLYSSKDGAHKQAGLTCIKYLKKHFSSSSNGEKTKADIQKDSFLAYAAANWPMHIRNCGEYDTRETSDVSKIMQPGPFFTYWTKARTDVDFNFYNFFIDIQIQPLHVAAYDGLSELMEMMCLFTKECLTKSNEYGEPAMALLVAANRGHQEIVENLITNGCDICAKDNLGRTPLFHSAAQGYKEILKMILAAPKDTTEISDRYGTFPVDIAAFNKEEEIALELLGKSKWMKLDNYEKLLRIAAEKGLGKLVKKLLENGELNVDAFGEDKNALHLATSNGHLEEIKLLVAAGANVTLPSRAEKYSVLHFAVENGDIQLTKYFLEEMRNREELGQWTLLLDQYEWTPLHKAAEKGHADIVDLLLNNTTDGLAAVNAPTDWPLYPLCLAARQAWPEVVKILLGRGAEVNKQNKNLETALFVATSHRHQEVVELLLSEGADPRIADRFQRTPIELAKLKGFSEVTMEKVLQAAANNIHDHNLQAPDLTPLKQFVQACTLGDKAAAQKLLDSNSSEDKNAWLDYRDDNGNTLLHLVAYSGDKGTVQFLLENNVPDQPNKYSDTPLDVAVMKGHKEMVSLLLSVNADQSYLNNDFRTPLHIAAERGDAEIADILLAKMPDEKINAVNKWFSTPLHLSAEGGYLKIVEALLKRGADITARNLWFRTPLDLALENAHFDVSRKLSTIHTGDAVAKEDPETEPSGKLRTMRVGDAIPEQDPETECRWQNNVLHIAVRTNNLEAARSALEQNSDFLNMQNLRGDTPLHIAARNGSQPILNVLLEKCRDVNILTLNKMTALHLASIHQNQSLAEALIAHKASVNAVNFWRWTPLHYAVRARATATVKVLLKNLAAVDATTDGGHTPLHFAAENQDEALMQILIEEGKSRQDLKNEDGLTPADVLRIRQGTIGGGL